MKNISASVGISVEKKEEIEKKIELAECYLDWTPREGTFTFSDFSYSVPFL